MESLPFVRSGRPEAFPQDEMKERAKIQCEVIKALLFPMASTPEWHEDFRIMAQDFAQWWDSTEAGNRSVSSAIMFIMEAKTLRIFTAR